MNFDGVGFRYDDQVKDKYLLKYNDSVTTNNNGLGFTVALLEELYTNPNYPSDTPQLKGTKSEQKFPQTAKTKSCK